MAVEEHWSYLRTDSGFHQTFWIAEWPRQKVFPGFLHPLIYVGEFRHTVTQVIRAIPTDQALRDIRSAQEAHETRRRINARSTAHHPRTAGRGRRSRHSARKRSSPVTATSACCLRHHHRGHLWRTGPPPAGTESAAAGAFVELRLLAGQQWPAFIAGALPLGRGLR